MVCGVLHTEVAQFFSVMDDELRDYPKAIVRMMREAEDKLLKFYDKVYAVASPKEVNSSGVLRRIGFTYYGDSPDGEIFVWQTHSPGSP